MKEGRPSCNKCGFIADSTEVSFQYASPEYRLRKMRNVMERIKPQMEEQGLCGPVCLPLLKILQQENIYLRPPASTSPDKTGK